jgi:hypothetical protein
MFSTFINALNGVGPSWGWLLLFAWGAYQLYWPFNETKLQQWHTDFTTRLRQIETGQVALAEEVDGASAEQFRRIHDQDRLSTTDLKANSKR